MQVKVSICTGSKCVFYGATHITDCLMQMQEELQDLYGFSEEDELIIEPIPCNNDCKGNHKIVPVVYIDGDRLEQAEAADVMDRVLYRLAGREGEMR